MSDFFGGRFDMRDEETFFTNAERSLIAKLMLDQAHYYTPDDPSDVHVGKKSSRRPVKQGRIQEFSKGGPVSHLPFLSPSLLPYLFLSPPPLELVPLKPAWRSGGAL